MPAAIALGIGTADLGIALWWPSAGAAAEQQLLELELLRVARTTSCSSGS